MRNPLIRVLAPLVVLLAPIASYSDKVDDYVRARMSREHIPGLSLVVIHRGKIVKARGYGLASQELRVKATPETVYELASATKPFIAAAILMLAQDGRLGLDDPVSRFMPHSPPSWMGMTIRHLLTHTSGIKDYLADLRRDFPYDTPADRVVRASMEAPLNFAPGERWAYSNTGYILLGMIVGKVSGKTYGAFLNERIFTPLGMTSTRLDSPDGIVPNRAVGYLWYGPAGLRNGDYLKYLMMNHGDRGVLSTVLDLAKWDAALSNGRLLTAASREAMWTPVKLRDGSTYGYGLGWFVDSVNGHRHLFHPGGAPGTATILSRYPDDELSVILLTNGGAAYPQSLDFGIAQRYVPGLVSRTVVKLPPGLLDTYRGYYNAYGSQILKVTREKQVLYLDDGGRLTNGFLPLSKDEFVAEDADRGVSFTHAPNGEPTGMTLRLIGDRMNVQRLGPLARSIRPEPDLDPTLTGRVEAALRAFAQGGEAVATVPGIASEARKDFARGPATELSGLQALTFVASRNVAAQGIERHSGRVSRLLYFRMRTDAVSRYVLVYLTAGGDITDEDVVDD